MHATPLRVFLCLFASFDYASAAPKQDEQCDFNGGVVSCVCADGADIVLSHVPSRATALTIANCRRVSFWGASFKDSTLTRLEIANSTAVKIPDFIGLTKIDLVEFINIADLQIRTLYYLRTDKLEMRNVTIKSLNRYAIPGEASIDRLRIVDSVVEVLTNGSLHFKNGLALEIIGCKIGLIEGNAVTVEDASNLTIRESDFILDEEALNLINVSNVLIDRNEIRATTVASFLASSIGELKVSRNNFRSLGAQTFYHMGDMGRVIIENNRFIEVDEQGLSFHPEGNILSVVVRNNRFSCDCNLFWLWPHRTLPRTSEQNFEYQRILNSSFCDRPDALADLNLVDVMPFVNREKDECIRMEPIVEVDKKRRSSRDSGRFRALSAASKVTTDFLVYATLLIAFQRIICEGCW